MKIVENMKINEIKKPNKGKIGFPSEKYSPNLDVALFLNNPLSLLAII